MDKIRTFVKQAPVAAALGFVLGLIIGLPLLGWWIWPVQWKDAEPRSLRADLKDQYICMVIDSFSVNHNRDVAVQRLSILGVSEQDAPARLDKLTPATCNYKTIDPIVSFKAAMLQQAVPGTTPAAKATKVPTKPAAGQATVPVPVAQATATATPAPGGGFPTLLLGGLCLVLLLIGGALAYLFILRPRARGGAAPAAAAQPGAAAGGPVTATEPGAETPIAHFVTTYVLGDDLYDDSFSIDAPSGEFLGECGVGISDTIGVGDPKKVSAFEVWLFDKNDIQTITKVVMSSHTFNDPTSRQRLASKGEPVLIERGGTILLETASLQMEARVVEVVYGQGALPAESFFERVTLELALWPKQA
jgi:hypothetical protein